MGMGVVLRDWTELVKPGDINNSNVSQDRQLDVASLSHNGKIACDRTGDSGPGHKPQSAKLPTLTSRLTTEDEAP